MTTIGFITDGKETPSASGKTFDRKDPVTGKVATTAPAASLADVDAVTLSMAREAGGSVPVETAVLAILVVGFSNSFSKAVMGAIIGTRAFALRFALAMAASVAVAAMVHWVSTFQPGAAPI